ncbi:hypothetical protein M9H77_35104 [Catharanthus roseus]|uniref:Uncharacterized protein n=1 Tax=Catharanthus roseus TaxID=4058 RepID=A0ACB9ZN28_CATRO|nr:hypothetical protein M9H77_35104 [Catharanthus roseus]
MASRNSSEIITEISPYIRVYKDGTVERMIGSPFVLPSFEDPITAVSSKDINISSDVSARLYLPKITDPSEEKLPILIYFHGGGFFLESAFSFLNHRYLNLLVSQAKVLAISVEYRLAPEHPLPVCYNDSMTALQWVASHVVENSINTDKLDPWLLNHGNFNKLYMGGDSAGANIVHNLAIRAGIETLPGDVKITERNRRKEEQSDQYRIWLFVYPSVPGGIDNPMINPLSEDAPSSTGLACQKLFVSVAEKDGLRQMGEVDLIDVEGEGHCFQIVDTNKEKSKNLISHIESFIRD